MKITWWGWLIIIYVAYWWLKKNGYLNKMGRAGNSHSPDLDAVCRRAENFQDCFDCLMDGNGDTQRANIIATEAEGKCTGWGFIRKNTHTTL